MKTVHRHTRDTPRLSSQRKTCLSIWQKIAAWTLQTTAAIVFLTAGSSKIVGGERMVTMFNDLSFSTELRYLVGGFEIVGAMLLLFPDRAHQGSVLLSALMGSAIFAHLTMIEGSPIPAFILLCITAAIVWLRSPTDNLS